MNEQANLHAKGYESSGGKPTGMAMEPLQADLTRAVRPAILAVAAAAGLILLIVCVNVANLLLARNGQRRAEFAMRTALGASRGRLARQLLTESLLLAAAGGILGFGIAAVGVRLLTFFSASGLPSVHTIGTHGIAMDGGVFLFALVVTAVAGFAAGLMPVVQLSRVDLNRDLREGSRAAVGGERGMRNVLIVGEVALAVVLLVSAGLLLRSMRRLLAMDPGFDGGHVVTMQVQEYGHRYDDHAASVAFYEEAAERVRQLPGVSSAGFTSQLPLSGDAEVYGVEFDGRHDFDGPALRYAVTTGYLESMRIPLLSGRLLNESDKAGAPVSILISQTLARRVFGPSGERAALHQRIRVGPDVGHGDQPWATIVGVVGNVKQESLAVGDEEAFYIPVTQWRWPETALSLVVRTKGAPAAMAPLARDAVWSVDRNQPVMRVATMERLLMDTEAQRRFVLMLFELFALAALILAATGIYGIVSGSVTERTREIGIRAALGASRQSLLALVLRQGLGLSAAGVVLGVGGALAAGRLFASLLFGVSGHDLVTYCVVSMLLLSIAAIASLFPARRAASIDPMQALRAE